jgi:hypothetical protein
LVEVHVAGGHHDAHAALPDDVLDVVLAAEGVPGLDANGGSRRG